MIALPRRLIVRILCLLLPLAILGACTTTNPVGKMIASTQRKTVHDLDMSLKGNQSPPKAFARSEVAYSTKEKPGTIVIDTKEHYLYLIEGGGKARRYGVGVGREGFGWKGKVNVGAKQEWPRWHPPKEMIARERKKGRNLPEMMEGGPGNPLGARAMYLHENGRDTLFRIHGTTEPWTIGTNVSSGCIRMANEDVLDLYDRVEVGAPVVVR